MKAVSFMYVRPPGYNAESAKAAEIADEVKTKGQSNPSSDGVSASMYHFMPQCLPFVNCCFRRQRANEDVHCPL